MQPRRNRGVRCIRFVDRFEICILTFSCIQSFHLLEEIGQQNRLCLQIEGSFAGDVLDGKILEVRLLFARNVKLARLREMEPRVKCAVRVLWPELAKSQLEQAAMNVVLEAIEP